MQIDEDLFRLSPALDMRMTTAGGVIPIILVDNVYERPDEIREMALALPFAAPGYPYPGKIAVPPPSASLQAVTQWALQTANSHYLPNVPPIAGGGQPITAFRQVQTDFAIIDVHPDELTPTQRLPHVDPVPIFGLIYLNREERGGTLFFQPTTEPEESQAGYITDSNRAFKLLGRIEAAFNRMAIYPGFIPHTGQIAGEWIESEERFHNPRLTQRFVFFP
jgi:hypothetical protein